MASAQQFIHADMPPTTDPSVHRAIAESCRASGDELGALAHLIAAETLDAYVTGRADFSAEALRNVATGYFMKGEHDTAMRWYELLLVISPDEAIAYQNLAAIHLAAGRTEAAEDCRRNAYRIQRVFIEPAGESATRVLILCVGKSTGNVPFDALMNAGAWTRIKYAIDYAAPQEDRELPAYDVVFNAIGDADVAAPMTQRLVEFEQGCKRPLLNPPSAVARTQRHQLAALLVDLPDVMVASCIRLDARPASGRDLSEALTRAGIEFPVLARPIAMHGGEALGCHDDRESLDTALATLHGAFYLTSFHDFRSADGFYRKYRVIFIDGNAFPYHLAISAHWMVHYFSADMEGTRWKLDEESRFLHDPAAELGARVWSAIDQIGRRLALDYGGIDFTILPDGRVFVFEANATMLVHREREGGALGHKNAYIERIVGAFGAMLEQSATGKRDT